MSKQSEIENKIGQIIFMQFAEHMAKLGIFGEERDDYITETINLIFKELKKYEEKQNQLR